VAVGWRNRPELARGRRISPTMANFSDTLARWGSSTTSLAAHAKIPLRATTGEPHARCRGTAPTPPANPRWNLSIFLPLPFSLSLLLPRFKNRADSTAAGPNPAGPGHHLLLLSHTPNQPLLTLRRGGARRTRGVHAAAQASGRGGKGRLCRRSGHGGQWRSSVQAGGQTGSGASGRRAVRPGGAAALSGATQGRAEAACSVHAAVAGWPVAAGRVPVMAAANASI